MANVQPENGCIRIAYDLDQALIRADFTSLEHKLVRAVMHFTYGQDRTKAVIAVEDLRVFVTGEKRIRAERIRETLDGLIRKNVLFQQTINQNQQILGVQKDFDKWGGTSLKMDKMSTSIKRSITNNSNTVSSIGSDKMSTIVDYAHKNTDFLYTIGSYRTELKAARLLYREALSLARDPISALRAIRDYIDDLNTQDWFAGCKMRCVYMSSRFKQWYKSLPAKPRDVKDNEKITGQTYRYNTRTKMWVPR